MALAGSTGTGLDAAIGLIANDYGLNARISGAAIREASAAADGMNVMIIEAIRTLGLANDAEISTSDVYSINSYLRARHLEAFTALHGNDENMLETAFHRVQGDGGSTRLWAEAATDTVLDGIYHIAFRIDDGVLENEDGNPNVLVSDVANWLNTFLAADLSSGALANVRKDPQVHGTSRTGLYHLAELIVDDAGLNHELSQAQINAGVSAADAMDRIIVQAIRATGVADDGTLTELDMVDVNHWIAANKGAAWAKLHGNDENGVETGFHLVQNDGGRGYIYGQETVDTVADGIYHLGFAIDGDRLLNEDGNDNARLADVADWLSLLLADDLASGKLASGHAAVKETALATDKVYGVARTIVDNGDAGALNVRSPAGMQVSNGTIALDFAVNHPDDGNNHAIFSKDGNTSQAGDVTVWVNGGQLYMLYQDGTNDHWIRAEGVSIAAGQKYSLAVTFGADGLGLWLDGQRVAVETGVTGGIEGNNRALVIGGSDWGRGSDNPTALWDHLDGTVSNFSVYDRTLDRFELAAINHAGALPAQWQGTAAATGELAAVHAGTGLVGDVFDRGTAFDSIDDLISQAATKAANFHFTASTIDFGGKGESKTLGDFLGDNAALTGAGAGTEMNTLGMHVKGFIWLEAGQHLVTVRSDDGFQLSLGGQELSRYDWGRGFDATSKSVDIAKSGLYAVDLYYFDNYYSEGLRLEVDGKTVGAEQLYASVADYQTALADHGAMPAGGLPATYDGPVGTTGTALDALVQMIGEDEGLKANISDAQIRAGAAAADHINHMIIDAVQATGALDDGHITTAETYDISDWIRAHDDAAFVAAHGNDETGLETGFHLVQGDGGTSYLFGEDAVNTVMDQIYHIGFATEGDRFLNEDGDINQRVEVVGDWLNRLLGDGASASGGGGGTVVTPLGSAAQPNIIVQSGLNATLGDGAVNLTLMGTASNGTGNADGNTLSGNDFANLLDGRGGDDVLRGGAGDDTLIGGAGNDTMTGGVGNDVYWVDSARDVIRESSGTGGGIDTVMVTGDALGRYVAATGIEWIKTGPTNLDATITGNALDNTIETGRGADVIAGGEGDDWIDGGVGRDTMSGGDGDDTFVVDNAKDQVLERAGEGHDTVYSAVTWTLGANVEDLVLTDMAKNATGNALSNAIDGNDGDNRIDGGAGADTLTGHGGNDVYLVDNAGDTVIETDGQGVDRVETGLSWTLDVNVENLTLTGAGNVSGTGNTLANIIIGNDGANTLSGLSGDDVLSGGKGADTLLGGEGKDKLTGGAGADHFVFADLGDSTLDARGRDTITDFSHADGDLIDLAGIDANGDTAGQGAFHFGSAFDGTDGALIVTGKAGAVVADFVL